MRGYPKNRRLKTTYSYDGSVVEVSQALWMRRLPGPLARATAGSGTMIVGTKKGGVVETASPLRLRPGAQSMQAIDLKRILSWPEISYTLTIAASRSTWRA